MVCGALQHGTKANILQHLVTHDMQLLTLQKRMLLAGSIELLRPLLTTQYQYAADG